MQMGDPQRLMPTVVQTATPPDLYGRVFGALQSMTAAFVGRSGPDDWRPRRCVFVAVTLSMLLNPVLQPMDTGKMVS